MSVIRPVGKVFHQISKFQQLAPLSTALCKATCSPAPKLRRPPTRGVKTRNRPTLKLVRTPFSRNGRPGTGLRCPKSALGRPGTGLRCPGSALGRPGTGLRRLRAFGVDVDPCFEAVQSKDPQTALSDSFAHAFFGACSSKAPLKCVATPLTARLSTSTTPPLPLSCMSVRHYSMEKAFKKLMRPNAKPCFAPKKLKQKPKPVDWLSPCACTYTRTINRCAKAKCAPHIVQCQKPKLAKPYRCPCKPKVVRMKKRKPGRKVLLGYKICKKPQRTKMFECFPKPPPVVPVVPTPKRCPCFTAREYYGGPSCKKVKNAKQPADCRTRRQPPVCMICPPKK